MKEERYVAKGKDGLYYHGMFKKCGGINTACRYSKNSMHSNKVEAHNLGYKFLEIKNDGALVEVPYDEQ
jgi:phosphosulfolactate synthase (CoM biosynthesis protein A)